MAICARAYRRFGKEMQIMIGKIAVATVAVVMAGAVALTAIVKRHR